MTICAILLAKPSMQVLYERVLRRPYPRSQRHVYIGMSQSTVPQLRLLFSRFFLFTSLSSLLKTPWPLYNPLFRSKISCCHLFNFCILILSFHLNNQALDEEFHNTFKNTFLNEYSLIKLS